MILGTDDHGKFEKYTKDAEIAIKMRATGLYNFYTVLNIAYTYSIVILAFTLYLLIIILLPRTLINGIS